MTDRQVNIPLLRKAVEWAEAEAVKPPELREWEQAFWSLTPAQRDLRIENQRLSGEQPEDYYDNLSREAYYKAPECGTCYCIAGYVAAIEGVKASGWETAYVAEERLGLDSEDADALFSSTNTIADVRRIAEEIAGERL